MTTTRMRSRGYTITLNNYNDEEYNNILELAQLHSNKWIFGKEIGKQGTPHIQGYLYFGQPKDYNTVVKLLDNKRIHIEKAGGNPQQNYTYCSKEGNFKSYGFSETDNNPKPYRPEDPLREYILTDGKWYPIMTDIESMRNEWNNIGKGDDGAPYDD